MPSTTAIAAAGGGTAANAPPAQMSMSAVGADCFASASRHCRSRRPRAARSAARRSRAPSPARSRQGDSRRFRSRSASENGSDRMALHRAISSTCPGSSSAWAGTSAASADTRWPTPPVGYARVRTPPLCPISTASMRRSSRVASVATDRRRVCRPSGRSRAPADARHGGFPSFRRRCEHQTTQGAPQWGVDGRPDMVGRRQADDEVQSAGLPTPLPSHTAGPAGPVAGP